MSHSNRFRVINNTVIGARGVEAVIVNPDPPGRKARNRQGPFAQIKLKGAAEVARKIRSPSLMFMVALAYMIYRNNGARSFALPNALLTQYGVSRENKRQALARFEKDGVIRVERRGRRSPIVTVLVDLA